MCCNLPGQEANQLLRFLSRNKQKKDRLCPQERTTGEEKILGVVMQYLQDELKKNGYNLIDENDWSLNTNCNVPQQENTEDCGIFVCLYCEFILTAQELVALISAISFTTVRGTVVSQRIFVRCQRLMARMLAFGLGFNRGVRPFYAACCFDVLSRGSVLCLLNASFG